MQIPPFCRTFSQKINPRESAKYHTFPFQALVVYVHPARGNIKTGARIRDVRAIVCEIMGLYTDYLTKSTVYCKVK